MLIEKCAWSKRERQIDGDKRNHSYGGVFGLYSMEINYQVCVRWCRGVCTWSGNRGTPLCYRSKNVMVLICPDAWYLNWLNNSFEFPMLSDISRLFCDKIYILDIQILNEPLVPYICTFQLSSKRFWYRKMTYFNKG